eukprot:TRINITY_DN21080_c0_g1_i1.p1 TRINITY_DN21080_c0_g1~~TRINITY_DN21080_c0_g1_i1.p1  ORF type:complete len:1481 (-),score=340.31 TRINITY_DN21080_c0_g1_i1:97-4539(-)
MNHGAASLWFICFFVQATFVVGDVYMNSPRGSNNKLTEQNNNAQNQNRLFDSQNNAAGGYQVGDNCVPNCLQGNTYKADRLGSQEGVMYYYHGSELHLEWTVQHGCGTPQKNTACQVVLQYMCDSDSPGLRDGKDPDAGSRRRSGGGNQANPNGANRADSDAPARGRHEEYEFYDKCRKRKRNRGLYIADRNLNNNIGAAATRQNNNGNRRGLECPEERDYYPYWHPAPWRDIVVFTSEPTRRCDFYKAESQNVKGKFECIMPPPADGKALPNLLPQNDQVPNNKKECEDKLGTWTETPAWNIPAPECFALPESRDNHHGNLASGKSMSYMWTIPDTIPDNDKCVIRLRYNMTSGDYDKKPKAGAEQVSEWDYFFDLDWRYNAANAPLKGDPKADFVGLGYQVSGPLQVQVNTAQFGRTFQDRTHVFNVKKRPDEIPTSARIVNFNVRGRRGNIVQVYPSVEYDFVPEDVEVEVGDYLHFQWTGSDANNGNNAGNGRAGTDRSNLVQIKDRAGNVPMDASEHTLFYNAAAGENEEGRRLVEKFAFLDQQQHAIDTGNACPATKEEAQNRNDNDDDNCHQLNAAPAYFDGGLVKMTVPGAHHVASTRNNDFSNRSQKATIFVRWRLLKWYETLAVGASVLLVAAIAYFVGFAVYALQHPTAPIFSSKERPFLLRTFCCRRCVAQKERERKRYKYALEEAWKRHNAGVDGKEAGIAVVVGCRVDGAVKDAKQMIEGKSVEDPMTMPPKWLKKKTAEELESDIEAKAQPGKLDSCCAKCCACCSSFFMCFPKALGRFFGATGSPGAWLFLGMNFVIGLAGFLINMSSGFNYWYGFAKAGGFMLDFNLSVLLVPTLRSVQMFARQIRALDSIFNSDPIGFHITVAMCVVCATIIHVFGHVMHMSAIVTGPVYTPAITPEQKISGTTLTQLVFDPATRAAPLTGLIIMLIMGAMFTTASARIRRSTFNFAAAPRSMREVMNFLLLALVLLFLSPMLIFWIPYRYLIHGKIFDENLPKKLGGFRIFWAVHKNWVLVYILLLVHGPQCWIWFLWPLILVCCDRLVSKERRSAQLVLQSAELLKGKVIKLTFSLPPGFVYQAGQYIQLNCDQVGPEEWHPFTLTSCPEEDHLSVHIRCPDDLDWCSELRRTLLERPAKKIAGDALQGFDGCRLVYKPHVHGLGEQVYKDAGMQGGAARKFGKELLARPMTLQVRGKDGAVTATYQNEETPARWHDNVAKPKSPKEEDTELKRHLSDPENVLQKSPSLFSLEDVLRPSMPMDALRIRLDGPHGAPSELVWRHRVVMLVGAGIGVTPFASILKSVQYRSRVQQTSLAGAEKSSSPVNRLKKVAKKNTLDNLSAPPSDWQPCEHIHFYWLCRSQEEFVWFIDLLSDAIEGPARDRIEVNLFQTAEVELTQVKKLGAGFRQFMGRPNWNRIFPKVAEAHAGEHVGVFLCGPPALRGELQRGADNALAKAPEGTSFTVHAENF